jgi:hypothetical protein
MDITTIIILSLSGLCLGQWHAIIKLQSEATELRRSKDDLRESLTKHNYYPHQQLERVKGENYALRTQNHQLRKERQKQDN